MLRVTLFLALTAASVVHADERPSIEYPRGWTDVSFGAPEANFAGVPQEFVQAIIANRPDSAALSPDKNAVFLGQIVEDLGYLSDPLLAAFTKAGKGGGDIIELSRTRIARRLVGKVIVDKSYGDVHKRLFAYLVPSGNHTVVLSYSADPEVFERNRKAFEECAASNIIRLDPAWWSLSRGEVVVAVLCVVFVLLVIAFRQRRRRTQEALVNLDKRTIRAPQENESSR